MQALSLLQYDILKDVPHCFTTRLGGVSKGGQSSLNLSFSREPSRKNVLENYRRVSEALGVAFEGMTHVPQHHGDHVLVVTEKETGSGITKPYPDGAEAYGYDAMITDVPGTVLCTLHADCVPVFLLDPCHRAIAMIHAGWRGTAGRIVQHTLADMETAYDTRPQDVLAYIGPSIGPCCFQVGEEVRDAFLEKIPQSEQAIKRDATPQKWKIDLWAVNQALLQEAGVPETQIEIEGLCTMCHGELFYSHRAMGESRGSMAAFLSLKELEP